MLTIVSVLLSACGPTDNSHGKDKDKNKDKDKDKVKDSGDEQEAVNANKVTICHRTGSAKNPYVEINVAANAVKQGHGKHAGDIIPAPEDGCPATAISTVSPIP